jgi:transcriptional regulator with XRE-family HTH domain
MPWHKVAEKLGVSRGMLMMVLRGDRRLSTKALFRLEQTEREAADLRSAAERIVEGLIGERGLVAEVLGRGKKKQGTVEVAVEYVAGGAKARLPATVLLAAPSEEAIHKLRALFAETLDTRLIALACLPDQLRSEGYLDQLTAESKARLTNAALTLVIPDWRTLVVKGVGIPKGAK